MSTIVVFGGTGKTGAECVYQALEGGNKVVVLARSPEKMIYPEGSGGAANQGRLIKNGNLKVVQGNVCNQADVDAAFAAAEDDVIGSVVALGGKTKDVGPTMLTDGTSCIINAMKAKGVKRVSVVTSIGAGDSEKQAPLFFKALMYTVMSGIFKDKNNQEKLFTGDITGAAAPGSELEWCIVRPGGLGTGPPTGVINVIEGEAGSIARADVAQFCLGAITDANFPYLRKTPCISSVGGTSWVKEKGANFDAATTA
jgi:nucleoside-diphosphate-sugar epimerase